MCRPHTQFVLGSNLSGGRGEGEDRKGARKEGGKLSQTLQGASSRPWRAGLRMGGGPWR